MLWSQYGGVVGWIFVIGVLLGAAVMFVLFGWLVPPDAGEEAAVVLMPFIGAIVGAFSALAASLGYGLAIASWTRRPGRTLTSRATIGGAGAGGGILVLWIGYGLATSGGFGLIVWVPIALACAVIASIVTIPLTARAARRADREECGPNDPFSDPAAWS